MQQVNADNKTHFLFILLYIEINKIKNSVLLYILHWFVS